LEIVHFGNLALGLLPFCVVGDTHPAAQLLDNAVVRDGWPIIAEMLWRVAGQVNQFGGGYCSFAYSALASFRIGMSGSASFQSVRKSWYAAQLFEASPWSA
jgi:hypothetical protein